MASEKILAKKQEVIDEIKKTVEDSETVVLFTYRGLTDEESKALRRSLRENGSDYKVYKNTLMARAFKDLKIDVEEHLQGSSALAYGSDAIAPIKVLSEFAKDHDVVTLKVGVVDGEISDQEKLAKLATIPSREGLLTMLAAGMMGIPKDLSICLDLYAKQKEEN
jgi:large subunit ribosomal protein L10